MSNQASGGKGDSERREGAGTYETLYGVCVLASALARLLGAGARLLAGMAGRLAQAILCRTGMFGYAVDGFMRRLGRAIGDPCLGR